MILIIIHARQLEPVDQSGVCPHTMLLEDASDLINNGILVQDKDALDVLLPQLVLLFYFILALAIVAEVFWRLEAPELEHPWFEFAPLMHAVRLQPESEVELALPMVYVVHEEALVDWAIPVDFAAPASDLAHLKLAFVHPWGIQESAEAIGLAHHVHLAVVVAMRLFNAPNLLTHAPERRQINVVLLHGEWHASLLPCHYELVFGLLKYLFAKLCAKDRGLREKHLEIYLRIVHW